MFYNYIHTRREGVQLVGVEIEKLPYIERDNIINTPPLICLCIYIYIMLHIILTQGLLKQHLRLYNVC